MRGNQKLEHSEPKEKKMSNKSIYFTSNVQPLFSGRFKQVFQKQPPEVFCKKTCSEKFPNFHIKTPVRESLLLKLKISNLIKRETPTQIFSCEICKIFKNTYIQKHLWTTASDFLKAYPSSSLFGKILSASKSTGYKLGIFVNVTRLFDQMQPYQKLKNVSLTFQSTFLLNSY